MNCQKNVKYSSRERGYGWLIYAFTAQKKGEKTDYGDNEIMDIYVIKLSSK